MTIKPGCFYADAFQRVLFPWASRCASHSLLGKNGWISAAAKVFQFKLVLLGDSAVENLHWSCGVRGQFSEYQESTIEVLLWFC